MSKVKITSSFWGRYRELIPYQWQVLNDTAGITIEKERDDAGIPNEKSHAIENFRIAAGRTTGTHYGWTFQDSDVYKWLEAVAYSLREKMDPELEQKALSVIDLIEEAQEPDGYLDTYFSILGIEYRYQSLAGSHELYCMGHFIEAAVAYYETTGNEKVLNIAKKCADNIDANFGPEKDKIHGYDGHEEIEIGLLRLYHVTGQDRYLNLAKYFLTERGKHPNFFKDQAAKYEGPNALNWVANAPNTYFQNHAPISEQTTAEGHAVRVVYLCTALADLAATTGDQEILSICKTLWNNIVECRMFITGGIGSTVHGEAFTMDYDLPNDTMYCETCAAIGLIFFARQMLRIDPDGQYADVMERALYNCAIAGMALDGKHFFYVNPLEVNPLKSKKDPSKSHVKPVRPSWLGCACCPPNLARMITSLDDYVYTIKDNCILVNQYIESDSLLDVADGVVLIKQTTGYPWDEQAGLYISNNSGIDIRVGIRIPSWSENFRIRLGGNLVEINSEKGYHYVEIKSGASVVIGVNFDMTVLRNYANPHVSEDVGKVAVSRGPFIYCLESVDNGADLNCLSLPVNADFKYEFDYSLLNGVGIITATGKRVKPASKTALYFVERPSVTDAKLTFIPYYAWANRGENEMQVWIRE